MGPPGKPEIGLQERSTGESAGAPRESPKEKWKVTVATEDTKVTHLMAFHNPKNSPNKKQKPPQKTDERSKVPGGKQSTAPSTFFAALTRRGKMSNESCHC